MNFLIGKHDTSHIFLKCLSHLPFAEILVLSMLKNIQTFNINLIRTITSSLHFGKVDDENHTIPETRMDAERESTNRLSQQQHSDLPFNFIADFFPGYFALVMATGIVSIAAHQLKIPFIPSVLLWMNIGFFGVLLVFLLLRSFFWFYRIAEDITDHQRGPGFFTLIAGTCVLGSQVMLLLENAAVAKLAGCHVHLPYSYHR